LKQFLFFFKKKKKLLGDSAKIGVGKALKAGWISINSGNVTKKVFLFFLIHFVEKTIYKNLI